MTFFSNSNINKFPCEKIAENMGLTTFEFINYNSGYNYKEVSETNKVEQAIFKHTLGAFDLDRVPDKNILIYDDAVKSGLSIDEVAKQIRSKYPNSKIVAIAQVVWTGRDLPPTEVLDV